MVNIEELSEEDQRKYIELQEYIKQKFLSGVRKDRSGKVTMTQDFELPAIKVNNDKIEVIATINKPETDLSTKLTELSDKFERAFSNQHSQVAKMIARLEKVEGKSNFPNDSIPQLDSKGYCKQACRQRQEPQLRHLFMAYRLVSIRDNHHCRSRPRLDRLAWPV
jgi:hypothetical protein